MKFTNVVASAAVLMAFPSIAASIPHDSLDTQAAFEQHMAAFFPEIDAGTREYLSRLDIFRDNAKFASEMQALERSGAVHDLASSPFATTPRPVFAHEKRMTPRNPRKVERAKGRKSGETTTTDPLPDAWDWREHGAVSAVKDQGALGTCWAFSTAANIEGQDFLKGSKTLSNFSVEQFVECDNFADTKVGEADCGEFGGWPDLAYQYVMEAGGLRTWEDFPYCAGIPIGKPGNCVPCMASQYNKTLCGDHGDLYCNASTTQGQDNVTAWCSNTDNVAVKISNWHMLSNNETEIAAQLVSTGPLSILLNAATLQFYHKGVADPALCNPSSLDHAVLLVGYGEDAGKPYWTVKNSWGTKWGEEGYFRMIRGEGKCGINRWVTTSEI